MVALLRNIRQIGTAYLFEADPAILTFNDVVYVPIFTEGIHPGLYDHGQKFILQSWYFRGSNPLGHTPNLATPLEVQDVKSKAPDDLYIYGGWLHSHFGHYILSSFSRLWSRLWEIHSNAKILVHAAEGLDWWFARPWFAALMAALNLTRDNFVSFDAPTALRRIIVTGAALEEEHFVHRVFAQFGNDVGRRLAGDLIGTPDPRPVYLSKERLRGGVQRLENESDISAVLERNGVEVIFPEELSIAQQAALWYNRPYIASFTNSALHASIFAPGRNIVGITYGDSLRSNYTLVDRANSTQSLYLSTLDGQMTVTGQGNGFAANLLVSNPIEIAENLLRVLDFQQRCGISRSRGSVASRRGYWSLPSEIDLPSDPDLTMINLALDKPVRQSSAHPYEPFRYPNANSGIITGRLQFHTDIEENPWWEIDLQQSSVIRQVRLYNRLECPTETCDRFTFSVKDTNDDDLRIVHIQEQSVPFGGIDGTPFIWTPEVPVTARYFRLTRLARTYLHLDQVEIIGAPIPVSAVAHARTPNFSNNHLKK